ncbi:hypothetical protein [Megasphaera sp.]|uniref:hypothetical protein n=1 Tax=Megasphaera sp. TaxID=2023260 RepID=UPI0027BB0C5F|nr:hypothetical protein [Megasphaera sp.]
MLLAMPLAGSYASSTLWTEGEEISDEYTLPPLKYGVTVDKNDEKVKATGDVIINNNDPSDSWPIIGASGQGNKSFTLDMDGHSLTTGDRGFFINFSGGNDNKVAITNADNIVSNFHKISSIFSWGEGHNISLDAKKILNLIRLKTIMGIPRFLFKIRGVFFL